MASEDWSATRPLIEKLKDGSARYNFFHAVRSLECLNSDKPRVGMARSLRDEYVRFGQQLNLGFAPASIAECQGGGVVKVWDTARDGETLLTLTGHKDWITSIGISSDAKHIVSGSRDKTVKVWDITRGGNASLTLTNHKDWITSVGISSDAKYVVSGSRDKTVKVWDITRGGDVFQTLVGHKDVVTSVEISSDGTRIASGSKDGTVKVWDIARGGDAIRTLVGHEGPVTSVGISGDAKYVVSGSEDGTVKMWDVARGGDAIRTFAGHEDAVTSVGISSDAKYIVSGSRDNAVRVWDAHRDGEAQMVLDGHQHGITSVGISSDGARIVSGSEDGSVQVWNTERNGEPLLALRGNESLVTSVRISSDGHRFVAAMVETPRLQVNFMGLMGPNGPMPERFTELFMEQLRGYRNSAPTRFLDIFHNRLIALFYRAWAVHQKTVSFDRGVTPQGDFFGRYIASLIGVGSPAMRGYDSLPPVAKLHYAGQFVTQTRSPEGLCAILKTYFMIDTQILEFVGHWLIIPKKHCLRLGETPKTGVLGSTTVVGARMWDYQQKFRIRMGPMNFNDFRRMLPDGDSFKRLVAWVRYYSGDALAWDAQMVLLADEVPKTVLGRGNQLGWSTWIRSQPFSHDAEDLKLSRSFYT